MKIIICGDVAITPKGAEIFKNADEKAAFSDVTELLKTGDFNLVNLECAVTESEKGIEKIGPCIKGPVRTVETLKKAGFTHCLMSNNHIYDYGKKGLCDTLEQIRINELGYTGIGDNYEDSRKNLLFEKDGIKVAVVNVCEHEYSYATENREGARPFDEFETMHDIRLAKKENDYVIVVYHGGKEFCRYPSPRLLKACREMVRCGADVVLCQHSHIIGCCEDFEGGHILYGQGNFHFVGYNDEEFFNEGLACVLDINSNSISVNYIPVAVNGIGISLARGERKEKILSDMKERNKELQNGKWLDGWDEFCRSVEPWYNTVRKGDTSEVNFNTLQSFAHYLDCEAHRDVWMQLFPTWNKTN